MIRAIWLLTAVLCVSAIADPPAASQPDAGDWQGFHRGGPLRGATADGPAPPLRTRWTYLADKAGITGGPAIVGQSVYVADDRGGLHCIDLVNGKRRWLYKAEAGFATVPLVEAGRVFLGDRDGYLHAVDAATGEKAWVYDSGDPITGSANLAEPGRVVFANDSGKVVCLSADDGKPTWTLSLERINGAVAVANGIGWVASCDEKLRSLDLARGQVLVAVEIGSQTGASPTVSDAGVIIGTNDAKVLCVDGDTGQIRWTFDKIQRNAFVYSSSAVAEGVVVVGARDNNIYGLSLATGQQLWRFETQGNVDGSPAIVTGRRPVVYVGSSDGKLYCLDLRDGRRIWQFDTGQPLISSPASARGVIVFGDSGGVVHCLESRN